MEDSYGNPYEFVAEEREVTVEVSEEKVLFGVAAMTAALTAGGLALAAALAVAGVFTAVGAPFLAGAAAVAYAAAEVAGQEAQDPPDVDKNYTELISLESFRSIEIKSEGLPSINRFFGEVIKACELLGVLSTIHGKILGADLGQDRSAAYQQRMSFRQGVELLEQLAARVQEAIPPAQKELAELFADLKYVEISKSWADKEMPPEIEKIINSEFTEQPAMLTLAKSVGGMPELLARLGSGEFMTYFATAIMHAVMAVRSDALELLTPVK